jgi:hypothetical protein
MHVSQDVFGVSRTLLLVTAIIAACVVPAQQAMLARLQGTPSSKVMASR